MLEISTKELLQEVRRGGWVVKFQSKAFGDASKSIDSSIVPRFLFAHYLNVSMGT